MFMYKYLQVVLTTLYFSSQRPILFCTVECSAVYRQILQPGRIWYLRPGDNLRTTIPPKLYPNSTVTVNQQLRRIDGYGQSTVVVNPQLRSIYGCGYSILLLQPLSTHYGYNSAIFRLYAISECNFSSIVYLQ